jgi:hypothetical protein
LAALEVPISPCCVAVEAVPAGAACSELLLGAARSARAAPRQNTARSDTARTTDHVPCAWLPSRSQQRLRSRLRSIGVPLAASAKRKGRSISRSTSETHSGG